MRKLRSLVRRRVAPGGQPSRARADRTQPARARAEGRATTDDTDPTTEALDSAALVRGLLATLPRSVRVQLAREVLGLPLERQVDDPHHVDTSERAVVVSMFDGLSSR